MNVSSEDSEKPALDPFFSPTLQLILKCSNLPTPSYLKLYQNTTFSGSNWTLFCATDVNDSDTNIIYKNQIKIQYHFPIKQMVSIEIWRVSMGTNNLFGSSKFNLVQLLRSPSKFIDLPLQLADGVQVTQPPLLKIGIDESIETKDILSLTFGTKLHKRFLFAPRMYYSLWKSIDFGQFTKVLQSPQITGHNPVWPPIQVKVSNQFKQTGVLRVVIHDRSDKILGHSEFSYVDIVDLNRKSFDLIKFEKRKNNETEIVDQGVVELIEHRITKGMTFSEFFTAGLEFQYYAIVDFSQFCKQQHQEDDDEISYVHEYKEALKLVTNIISSYLGENDIVAYGVGASKDEANREFFPFKQEKKVIMATSKALLAAFDDSLKGLQGRIKTKLLPAIRETMKKIKTDMVISNNLKYYVCAIFMTDEIADLQEVIDQIVLVSFGLPISFVILDISKKASSQLRVLQTDVEQLKDSHDRVLDHVNVKCVCLSEYSNIVKATTSLLEDIPKHIWAWLSKFQVEPNNFALNETHEKYVKLSNLILTDFPGDTDSFSDYDSSPTVKLIL